MIRNVVMGRLRPDADEAELEAGLAGIAGLRLPGQQDMRVGRDEGLRAGGWSFAIINDWDDADAYRAYDLDPEHNRYRAQVVAQCSDIARTQIRLD